jgi:hypothetical protein
LQPKKAFDDTDGRWDLEKPVEGVHGSSTVVCLSGPNTGAQAYPACFHHFTLYVDVALTEPQPKKQTAHQQQQQQQQQQQRNRHTHTSSMKARSQAELTDKEREEAIKGFEGLGLCTQLAEAAAGLGWKKPTIIQEQAVPPLIQGRQGLQPDSDMAAEVPAKEAWAAVEAPSVLCLRLAWGGVTVEFDRLALCEPPLFINCLPS